jgi:hypothetical protein
MSKLLKTTFVVHVVLSGVLGLVLLIMPGRFLQLLGWASIDPILSRILGAALLALAWGDYGGWRAASPACCPPARDGLAALRRMCSVRRVVGCCVVA